MVEESFQNCFHEMLEISINLPIKASVNCVYETPHARTSLPIQCFTMVEENFESCVCETLHIGINLPIHSFTMVDENFENHACETLHIGINYIFNLSPWLTNIFKIVFVKRFILASIY